jgi:hypothetical protein
MREQLEIEDTEERQWGMRTIVNISAVLEAILPGVIRARAAVHVCDVDARTATWC